MTESTFQMQQEDENREDLERAAAAGNACPECLSVAHTHHPQLPTDDKPAYLKGEVRFSVSTGTSEYAVSDGWKSRITGEEQFIVYNRDGVSMGRYDESAVQPWRLIDQPALLPNDTEPTPAS